MDKNNPDPYRTGGIESIDFIQAHCAQDHFTGFPAGGGIKNLSPLEPGAGEEDLRKARQYLNRFREEVDAHAAKA